jgi:hypothetical protein
MISTTSVECLHIYCQNVGCKHNWTINLLEQIKSAFNILFLQEPPWETVRYTTSLTEKDGVPVKGPPIHPDWISLYPKGFDLDKDTKIACVSSLTLIVQFTQLSLSFGPTL